VVGGLDVAKANRRILTGGEASKARYIKGLKVFWVTGKG
jgi:hypothetical protein